MTGDTTACLAVTGALSDYLKLNAAVYWPFEDLVMTCQLTEEMYMKTKN